MTLDIVLSAWPGFVMLAGTVVAFIWLDSVHSD
jgi:hypothetical protein